MDENKRNGLSASGVPACFLNKGLNDFETRSEAEREELLKVMNFPETKGGGRILLLLGPTGSGKTHLGCAVLHKTGGLYRKNKEINAEFAKARDFKSGIHEADLLERFKRIPMLVVDEIGNSSNEKLDHLRSILIDRYDEGLPTVLITNMDKKEIVNALGRSVYDRMRETTDSVTLTGQSRRKGQRTV